MGVGSTPSPLHAGETVPTREGYDQWAECYDGDGNPLVAMEEPCVADLLGDVRGLDVADLGCGTGRHTVRLVAAGARVTALDFSSEMVAKARGKPGWENVRFIEHDLCRPMPLADASFDRVLCCLVLDHVHNLHQFFGECRRLCRPAGFVLLSTMHPALMLRDTQARFTHPQTGRVVRPVSYPNQISDYVTAACSSGLQFDHMSEHVVDDALVARCPRAAKYLGWPLLLMMRLRYGGSGSRPAASRSPVGPG